MTRSAESSVLHSNSNGFAMAALLVLLLTSLDSMQVGDYYVSLG